VRQFRLLQKELPAFDKVLLEQLGIPRDQLLPDVWFFAFQRGS
jgi:hypothetical protein